VQSQCSESKLSKDVPVRFIDNIAIVLSKVRLLAMVAGNEVMNLFIVTEVYVKKGQDAEIGSVPSPASSIPSLGH
jgi:hypothetical protein